jgi:hypothetical protein
LRKPGAGEVKTAATTEAEVREVLGREVVVGLGGHSSGS